MFTSRTRGSSGRWNLHFDFRNPPKIDLLFLYMILAILAAITVLVYHVVRIIFYIAQ